MNGKFLQHLHSPLGLLEITSDDNGVCSVLFKDKITLPERVSPVTQECARQLDDYFKGNLTKFTLPLSPQGTDFQQRVWKQLGTIPFGKTTTYLNMAIDLGDAKCIRAAGTANGKNPVAIIIPCHRVIGTNGKLTGYAGGLWRKEWLLNHEAKVSGTFSKLF